MKCVNCKIDLPGDFCPKCNTDYRTEEEGNKSLKESKTISQSSEKTKNNTSTKEKHNNAGIFIFIGLLGLGVSLMWWGFTYRWDTQAINCFYSSDMMCNFARMVAEERSKQFAYTPIALWISAALIGIGIFKK